MTKELSIANSELKAIINEEHFERLSLYTWYINQESLSTCRIEHAGGLTIHISLPNEIFGTKKLLYDHRDCNPLNNLESNLRECNRSQNNCNRRKIKRKCSSQYKGVCWHKTYKMWYASIAYDGVSYHLGRFNTEVEAALAYNKAAIKFHGSFARLNVIC